MINYRLRCGSGHVFEGWFRSSAAFDEQADQGQLSCPICADNQIEKAIMAPAISRGRAPTNSEPTASAAPTKDDNDKAPVSQEVLPAAKPAAQPIDERTAKLWHMMRQIQVHVEKNFEDVGKRFPQEVRRMHEGETEHRHVYGEATLEDAQELLEEGIEILPLPKLPKLDG